MIETITGTNKAARVETNYRARVLKSAKTIRHCASQAADEAAATKLLSPSTQAILQHWREDVPNDRLGHMIRDAMRGIQRAFQMRLTEHSVSYGYWAFLRILWQQDGITQRALSEKAGVMEPTTYSALKAMEKLGYISRRQMPDNRKNVYVYLTAEGRALKDKLVPLAVEVNEIMVHGVSTADIAATRRTLLAIIENLAADEIGADDRGHRMPSTRELADLVASRAARG